MYKNKYTYELLIARTNEDKMNAARDYKMNACTAQEYICITQMHAHTRWEGRLLRLISGLRRGVLRGRAILGGVPSRDCWGWFRVWWGVFFGAGLYLGGGVHSGDCWGWFTVWGGLFFGAGLYLGGGYTRGLLRLIYGMRRIVFRSRAILGGGGYTRGIVEVDLWFEEGWFSGEGWGGGCGGGVHPVYIKIFSFCFNSLCLNISLLY